jgi:hypothetical protein
MMMKVRNKNMYKDTVINGKKYRVEHVFKMVGNYYFTDENGVSYLVDGEDVTVWAEEQGIKHQGLDTAIEYAKYHAREQEDGIFWWTVKDAK